MNPLVQPPSRNRRLGFHAAAPAEKGPVEGSSAHLGVPLGQLGAAVVVDEERRVGSGVEALSRSVEACVVPAGAKHLKKKKSGVGWG